MESSDEFFTQKEKSNIQTQPHRYGSTGIPKHKALCL